MRQEFQINICVCLKTQVNELFRTLTKNTLTGLKIFFLEPCVRCVHETRVLDDAALYVFYRRRRVRSILAYRRCNIVKVTLKFRFSAH